MQSNAEENLADLRKIEAKNLALLEEKAPGKLLRTKERDPLHILQLTGVTGVAPLSPGYIRFLPEDFIVEEVDTDGSLSPIEPVQSRQLNSSPEPKTIYANLVKYNLGTLDAIAELAALLRLPFKRIGYAGIKDRRAITSQNISIRGATLDAIHTLQKSQFFLSDIRPGKGVLVPGQLRGNRFTIHIRTPQPIQEKELQQRAQALAQDGFPNFYGPQRFGNRFLNTKLGLLVCQGKFEEAIRLYLTDNGLFGVPVFDAVRTKATRMYGDWEQMLYSFDILPFTFRYERAVLKQLIARPHNPIGALSSIADQVRFWVYGYTSYLVNQLLSQALTGNTTIPDPLPLPILSGEAADDIYAKLVKPEDAAVFRKNLRPLRFITQRYRTIAPWITPEIHHATSSPSGAILSFTLPKGVYATTFLMFFFTLSEGSPEPAWLKRDPIDIKKHLHTGSVAAAMTLLETGDIPVNI